MKKRPAKGGEEDPLSATEVSERPPLDAKKLLHKSATAVQNHVNLRTQAADGVRPTGQEVYQICAKVVEEKVLEFSVPELHEAIASFMRALQGWAQKFKRFPDHVTLPESHYRDLRGLLEKHEPWKEEARRAVPLSLFGIKLLQGVVSKPVFGIE